MANAYYTLLMLDSRNMRLLLLPKRLEGKCEDYPCHENAGMVTEAGLAQTEATYYNIYVRLCLI